MAEHSNARTTGLYEWRNDDVNVGEVERIGILGYKLYGRAITT
jgi:hypothetical protein